MKKASGAFSKTLLFNLVYGLVAVSVVLLDFAGYADFEPTAEVVALVSSVLVPAANWILRKYFTSEAIA